MMISGCWTDKVGKYFLLFHFWKRLCRIYDLYLKCLVEFTNETIRDWDIHCSMLYCFISPGINFFVCIFQGIGSLRLFFKCVCIHLLVIFSYYNFNIIGASIVSFFLSLLTLLEIYQLFDLQRNFSLIDFLHCLPINFIDLSSNH